MPGLMLSKMLADQTALCKAHPTLAQLAQVYADWVSDRCTCEHVKGNNQFAWNELAGSLAGFALKQGVESQLDGVEDRHQTVQQPFFTVSHMEDEHAASINPSMKKVTCGDLTESPQPQAAQVAFKAVTANVLAAGPRNETANVGRVNSARTVRLDQQWNDAGVLLAGLQETRTEQGKFQSENYHILSSGADFAHTSALGCEIWFHKSLSIAWLLNGQEIKLSQCKLSVQRADPMRLMARFDIGIHPLYVVALHAPCVHRDVDKVGE